GAGGKGAGGGDDVMTVDQYDNFEFQVDWRGVGKGGDSGGIICAGGGAGTSWRTGAGVEIFGNGAYAGRDVRELAGACYDLYAPVKDVSHGVGQWNTAKVVANGRHIEHWLNGVKLLEYELGSDDWKQRVAQSKFKDMKHFQDPPLK